MDKYPKAWVTIGMLVVLFALWYWVQISKLTQK